MSEHFTLTSDVIPSISSSPTTSSTETDTTTTTTTTTQQKQASLAALRSATVNMQDDINALLTARMDEDNARTAAAAIGATGGAGSQNKKQKVDENAEEDNYGEEVVDEDD